jgi:hypothetical protein
MTRLATYVMASPDPSIRQRRAIGVGISGLFLTGLIAGIAVHAMRAALTDRDTG